jgi:transcriptional regulator with XRE-family HTH domain
VCDLWYPGTRGGFILVVEVPPTAPAPPVGAPPASPAATEAQRRRELADFLRTRRARLQPEDVGLPRAGRRRTPGLRREEVALLAGVGTTWYTWLEQGRDVRASLDVLEAIARALRLSPVERTHLVVLGRGEPPPPQRRREHVSPVTRRIVEGLGPGPAILIGRRWDYLAWNPAAAAVFVDFAAIDPPARNLIWLAFTDPALRARLPDWEAVAHRFVEKFRADHARNLGDPAFEELIATLLRSSPEFAAIWRRHDVSRGTGGTMEIDHPEAGVLRFETAVFAAVEDDEQRLILYTPQADTATAERLAALLA